MILTNNSSGISRSLGVLLLLTLFSGCASDLQTKVSGHLNGLSKHQTVAILPVEASDTGQKEMGKMFRQGLYANLKQSKFNLMEKYIVDGLLMQNHLNDPAQFLHINPMQFGEILGADAIVFSRVNKVERSYFIVHSSIELSVSVQMVDTRTGEILWRAEQTEHDFSGIGKLPTGITTALLAPIQFVTNKFNLRKMTSKMVEKLTALVKKPENAAEETQFKETVIAKNATNEFKKIEELQQLKAEWDQALSLDDEMNTSTYQDTQSETLAQKKKSSPSALISVGNIQNKVPSLVGKVEAVEAEMVQLPVTLGANRKKIVTPTTPMSIYKTTLAIPTRADSQLSHDKVKLTKNTIKSSELYTVQVGAYKTKAYAQNLLKKLVGKGYNAFVIHSKIYKVRVDKFKNKQDAIELAKQIKKKEKLENFVTRTG
jgi:cell division septation protein DedD